MIDEKIVISYIEDLNRAIDFMRKFKAKKSCIEALVKNVDILKWVLGAPSDYEEIYNSFQRMREGKTMKYSLDGIAVFGGEVLNVTVKDKNRKKVMKFKVYVQMNRRNMLIEEGKKLV